MLETTTIDLLRHGECQGGDIFRGSLDVALSGQGWSRMRRVTGRHGSWQKVVCSPMQRCRAFAEWLAGERGLPLTCDDRLREMTFGDWEGRPVAEVWEQDSDAAEAWLADPDANPPPGGEPLSVLRQRADAALTDCLRQFRGQHILLVTHGGVMRAMASGALAMPPAAMHRLDMPWACLTRLAFTHADEGDLPRLLAHNMAVQ